MAKKRKTRAQKVKRRSKPAIVTAVTKKMVLRQAVNWQVLECLIARDWRDTKQITQVMVARCAPNGYVGVAGFIVDLGCLGVKDALLAGFASEAAYRKEYRNHIIGKQPMTGCTLDLAAKIIHKGIDYAASLGFKPHRDSKDALKLLAGANPENCSEQVPLGGENGKPFYFAGPYDNPDRIIRTLERSVGEGNFDCVVMFDDDRFGEFDEEDF